MYFKTTSIMCQSNKMRINISNKMRINIKTFLSVLIYEICGFSINCCNKYNYTLLIKHILKILRASLSEYITMFTADVFIIKHRSHNYIYRPYVEKL